MLPDSAALGRATTADPGALSMAGLTTMFQRSTDDSYRGRVSGALSTVEGITVLAGTLAAGYLSRVAAIVPVLTSLAAAGSRTCRP